MTNQLQVLDAVIQNNAFNNVKGSKLTMLNRRRYEHKTTKHVTPEFIKLIRQAGEQLEINDKLDALFTRCVIDNTSLYSKKNCTLTISVARNNGNIFVNHSKKPIVEAYINPITECLVREDDIRMDLDFDGTRDYVVFTPHHQFQMLAYAFAGRAVQDYINDLVSLPANELSAAQLKPINQIILELNEFLETPKLYKNISEELAYLHTPKVPNANQFMAFSDDKRPEYLVTGRVSYPNPMNHLDTNTDLVERFLDVFFDEPDKQRFSWYMGAALRNLPVSDASVSKLLMVTSAHAGSGKSTMVTALTNALFGKTFANVNGDFDSIFRRDNRFTSESLVDSRMNVYLEADFGVATKDGNQHDFNQLNVSTIKAMITDGILATEEKYESRRSSRAFGLHMVLTNHPAVITEETDAMRRRILPCLVRPTSMESKARQLGLFGQQIFEKWVQDHALEFAVYFVRQHLAHEYDYMTYLYNSRAFMRELNHYRLGTSCLDPLAQMQRNQDNIFSVLEIASQHHDFDLERFIQDIETTKPGISYDNIRISGNVLYINSAESFWSQYSKEPGNIRNILIELYGAPEKKYSKNRFTIPMMLSDLDDFKEARANVEAHQNQAQEIEGQVVDNKGTDLVLPSMNQPLTKEQRQVTQELYAKHKARIDAKLATKDREPLWMRHVNPSTIIGHPAWKEKHAPDNGRVVSFFQMAENGDFIGITPETHTTRAVNEATDELSREQLVALIQELEVEREQARQLMGKIAGEINQRRLVESLNEQEKKENKKKNKKNKNKKKK